MNLQSANNELQHAPRVDIAILALQGLGLVLTAYVLVSLVS